MERCRIELPALREIAPAHWSACHRADGAVAPWRCLEPREETPCAQPDRPDRVASPARHSRSTDLSQSGLVGKLENPTIITDPAQWPKKFGEAPALAELVKAGKLPSVEQAHPAGADGDQAAAQRRQIRRHLATRFSRPRRWRERQSCALLRQAAVLGRDGHAISRPTSPRAGRPAPTAAAPPCSCARV